MSDLCEELGNYVGDNITWSFGKYWIGVVPKTGITTKIIGAIIEGLHGVILEYGIEVKAQDTSLTTHYGHETPGEDLHFKILVNMRDELPERLVKCGWLAGVEFPKKGPIEGVEVWWEHDKLNEHGDLTCSKPCVTKTSSDGIATLVFRPKKEEQPGVGFEYTETGVVWGRTHILLRHRNVAIGFVVEKLLWLVKSDLIRWFVSYHKPIKWGIKAESVGKTSKKWGNLYTINVVVEGEFEDKPIDPIDLLRSPPSGTVTCTVRVHWEGDKNCDPIDITIDGFKGKVFVMKEDPRKKVFENDESIRFIYFMPDFKSGERWFPKYLIKCKSGRITYETEKEIESKTWIGIVDGEIPLKDGTHEKEHLNDRGLTVKTKYTLWRKLDPIKL